MMKSNINSPITTSRPTVDLFNPMTEQEILEILVDYIETSTTAMDVLKAAGYAGDRKRVVADVLRRGSVPQPPDFPGSRGCIIFGRAIAKYIMSQGSNSPVCTTKKANMTKSNNDSGTLAYKPTINLVKKMAENVPTAYEDRLLLVGFGVCDPTEAITEINRAFGYYSKNIDVIESDPDLCQTLEKKQVHVVHDSIESFETLTRYGWVIAMSPCHSLPELERLAGFVQPGGTLSVIFGDDFNILRKQIEKNYRPCNLSIVKVPGGLKTGKCNKTAWSVRMTRPTDTGHVCVLLEHIKNKDTALQYPLADIPKEVELRIGGLPHHADELMTMIRQCVLDQWAGLALMADYEAMKEQHLLDTIRREEEKDTLPYCANHPLITMGTTPNKFVDGIRRKYWRHLFLRGEYLAGLPSNIRDGVRNYANSREQYDFNGTNILRFRNELRQETENGMIDGLEKSFDLLSGVIYKWRDEYEHNEANVIPFNGYKTDKAWRIKNKVSISLNGICDESREKFCFRSGAVDKVCDLECLLDYLLPDKPEGSTRELLAQAEKQGLNKGIVLRHIKVSFYKKGTTHIEFLDPALLEKFNVFVCLQKGWLPPGYGKTAYEDFDSESRAVIDSFQGEEAYRAYCNESSTLLHSLPTFPLPE